MPLYDYKCRDPKCAHEFEEFSTIAKRKQAKCLKCGSKAAIIVSSGTYHQFEEGFWTDLAPDPIHIDSKKQLKAECRARGLWATGVLD